MKKFYSSPELEVSLVDAVDVLSLSGDGIINDDFGREDTIGGGEF